MLHTLRTLVFHVRTYLRRVTSSNYAELIRCTTSNFFELLIFQVVISRREFSCIWLRCVFIVGSFLLAVKF